MFKPCHFPSDSVYILFLNFSNCSGSRHRLRKRQSPTREHYSLTLSSLSLLCKRHCSHYTGSPMPNTTTTTPQLFYGPFSRTTQVSWCQKKTSGLYGAREIYRGRHTDHPAGRHSIQTNQCPPPPSPIFLYGPDALPAAQPTVSKHWRQLAHSD